MADKKPVDPAKKPAVQASTTSARVPVKKTTSTATAASVPPKKTTSTTTAASVPPKKTTPTNSGPGAAAATSKNPPAAAARPNSSGGSKAARESSPQNPDYEPPLNLKAHGFRVPVFKPRND